MHTARIDSIIMNADGTCRFSLNVDPSENYMGAPLFYVAQDHSLISAEWAV
ncbi:hypothetical protein [Prosthecobacter fluviatilis]|uniref:Uncharacterized protein n=1 Tax=Prosthecobacter fluviatilis TaxID=445931 RepID=A0ABW0KX74_9BACT